MITYFFFVLGTGLGAVTRFNIINLFNQFHKKNIATFAVNMLGCLIAGGLFSLTLSTWYITTILGFIGGFTTYSTFNNEVANLFLKKQKKLCIIYIFFSYSIGVLLFLLGYLIIKILILN